MTDWLDLSNPMNRRRVRDLPRPTLDGLAALLQDVWWESGAAPDRDFDYWLHKLSGSNTKVRVMDVDPTEVARSNKLRALVPSRVSRYAALAEKCSEIPPIVILGFEVQDGIHRTLAAAKVGCRQIPAVVFRDLNEVRAFSP